MPPRIYSIHVPDPVLDDLRRRLANTRWPEPLIGAEWDYGAKIEYIRELCEYWQCEYDWRHQENRLNAYPQFLCEVDGVDLHFWHVKGRGPNPFPLLLLHGWPGSVYEFYDLIGPLSDPVSYAGDARDAFDVIIPSLPGYGFSGKPRVRGWDSTRAGEAFHVLMTKMLGYDTYAAQGGDWGSFIAQKMATLYPDSILGIHLNFAVLPGPRGKLPPEDQPALDRWDRFFVEEGAYIGVHTTKPDSLTMAQSDSPAGLAAWIVEKFRTWSDCEGDVESVFSKDTLLTNIMFYWVTNSAASATRLYYESWKDQERNFNLPKIEVPVGVASFPCDRFNLPRSWAESQYNLVRWADMPRGGHFAALEEPGLLIDDIRDFFRPLR